nr:NAD-dependent epimerase/dehydratase family protein [Deltaproteobacteria bacterium]
MNLVIGGSGFIGSHLVRELVKQGERVRVYDLNPFPEDETYQTVEVVRGDILNLSQLSPAMDGCSTVYHLGGTPQLWSRDPKFFDRTNHEGTINVLNTARRSGIKRLIFTSTESILATPSGKEPITEDIKPRIEDMVGPYCRSKLLAEQAVFRAAKEGLPAVAVCPTLPIGPGDRNLTPPGQMISDFLQRKIPGYLDCTLNFIDVRDVATGHRLAAEYGRPGRRYILAAHNMTLYEFFQHLSRISGVPCPKIKIPYLVALAWSYMEHYIGIVTGKRPRSSITGVKLCKRSLEFNSIWTWKTLGHRPRPLDGTIRDAVNWHKKFLESKKTAMA